MKTRGARRKNVLADALKRTSGFLARSLELTADSVQQIDDGWVVLTPSLPQVWSLNHLGLTEPVSWGKAVELADERLGGLPYRHLLAENELGAALAWPLRVQGFKVECEVVMTLTDGFERPGVPTPEPEVVEPAEPEMLAVERRWLAEDEHVLSAAGVEQLLEAGLREGRAWGERRFGIAGDDGRLQAITKLRADGSTAQVEDVYTVPEARGRGFARTLVAHAAREARRAGNDLVFIVADDNDWPKHLYARLGFAPASLRWAFHREAGAGGHPGNV